MQILCFFFFKEDCYSTTIRLPYDWRRPLYDAHRYIPTIIRLLYDLNTWIAYSSPVRSDLHTHDADVNTTAIRCCRPSYAVADFHTLLPTFIRFSYATYWHLIVIGGGADRLRLFWNFQNSRSRRWLQYDSCRLARLSYVSTCTIADSPRSTRTAELPSTRPTTSNYHSKTWVARALGQIGRPWAEVVNLWACLCWAYNSPSYNCLLLSCLVYNHQCIQAFLSVILTFIPFQHILKWKKMSMLLNLHQ